MQQALAIIFPGLNSLNWLGPSRLDEREDGANVLVAQDRAESGHAGCHAHSHVIQDCLPSPADIIFQHSVVMMPGMAISVMGRGRENAVFIRNLPVGLPFELGTVAYCTVFGIKLSPALQISFPAISPDHPTRSDSKADDKQPYRPLGDGRQIASFHGRQIVAVCAKVNLESCCWAAALNVRASSSHLVRHRQS